MIKVKTKFILFILLLFCLGQISAAEYGDINSGGDLDIVFALLIAQSYADFNPLDCTIEEFTIE